MNHSAERKHCAITRANLRTQDPAPFKINFVTKVLLVLFLKPIVAYASLKAPAYVTIPPLDELHYPSRLLIFTTDLNTSNNTTRRVSATSTLISAPLRPSNLSSWLCSLLSYKATKILSQIDVGVYIIQNQHPSRQPAPI